MDLNQIARMIEWLDEERRRDKATIATLEERIAQQQNTHETLQRRINSIESEQTVIQESYVSKTRDQDVLDLVRKEVRQMMETGEARRLTAEREVDRRVELSRESLSRSVKEVSEKVTEIEHNIHTINDLQAENERLQNNAALLQQRVEDLIKRMDEPDRRLAFLEEQRKTDTRRISEAESEIPELKKLIEGIRPKLTLLEDLTLRNERRAQELEDKERERREQMQQFIDQQTLLVQQRDQQLVELTDRFTNHDRLMKENVERFETWSEAYRSMKRIIDDFNRIAERLERRINEVSEMQRLSEDRFRQEWNDWRDDDQKRWKQFTLSNDEVWRLHDKEFQQFVDRLQKTEKELKPVKDSANRLWNLERDRARRLHDIDQALLLEYDVITRPEPSAISTSENPMINGSNGSSS